MSELRALLGKLRDDGVQLWVDEGQLRVRSAHTLDPQRIAELRRRKAEIIALLEQAPVSRTTPLGGQPRPDVLPLSFAQEGLWFLDQLGLLGSAYNFRSIIRIAGDLDSPALRRAFDELVRRHELLRTRYRTIDGVGAQVIEPPGPARFEEVDLSALESEERELRVRALLQAHAEREFELDRECPYVVELIRLGPGEHLLVQNMHHIMIDGPSFAILFRELRALYGACIGEAGSSLPELRAQFADYALWQRRWLESGILDEQLSYWKARLADAPESLDLPFDRVRPRVPDFEGALHEFSLPRELVASLQAMARARDATLFMTLLAAFHVLLSRWSGQKDICTGLPVDGRGHSDADDLIGFFLNTVVVRSDLSENPTFEDVLVQVRGHLLDAYEHRDLPFDRLVAELRPERQLSRQPLFQVLFSYLTQDELTLPGLELTPVEPEDRTAKFDLSLFFSESGDGLEAGFEYATSLFEKRTIERLVRLFTTLLEGIVANPRARIADLPLLDEAERSRLLVEWNDTHFEFAEECVHERFEAQVARNPEATAVVFGEESLTYGALNARANQVAHHLRALGVVPDALIGVCVERSLDMIVALFGILKAGAAYVPLDPAYPAARLAHMLADSRASVVITQQALLPFLPEHDARVLCLDADWPLIATRPASNPEPRARSRNLAYCIYTSGSTGRPKGVALQHNNAAASLSWSARTFAADLGSVLFSTSICFDLSVFELFATLTAGGTAVLVRDALVLAEKHVTPDLLLINTVPSAAQALADADAIPSSVRVINLAGEPLRQELAEQLRTVAPQARVYNLYGPTEYTTYTTYCEVDGRSKVTIGRPLSNTKIYILDENGEPVPIGSSGEIHVAGAGLARGYWNRPELTAEKFVPDPFGPPSSRMYRTGDLARYLPDGSIEFLGRIDHQVKVRGYRIELGEIESTLLRCTGVSAAIVIAHDDPSAGRRLVAYVVADHRAEREIRGELQTTLPDFMLPAAYVFLDSLPLTPNGKIDRKALPVPGAASRSRAEYVAPRTPTEGLLAEIWSDVLKIPRIGIHDNFFELGGHSLLATQVVARIRQSLRADVLLRELFTAPSVAELARVVSSARAVNDAPIPRADRALPRVASFAQQRMWFLDELEPGSDLYNVGIAWRLLGRLDVTALEQAFNEILRRHDVLRTVFAADDGQPVPVVLDFEPVALVAVDVSIAADPEREAERVMESYARRPFDLAHGPMMRIHLIRLAGREHILMVGFHHIVADGWSLDVLLTELAELYAAFMDGKSSPLPELPIQYDDFARWQRDLLQGEVLDEHLSFWQRYLDGAPKALDLPSDRPRPQISSYRGGIAAFTLSEELSARLRELSQRRQVTLFMTMAAAFNVLLHRYSGQDDICIGYSVGNRDRLEIEGLIGIFVNTLVLRTRVGPGDTFEDELTRVREAMLDADVHKDLPFEKLVEELRPERDLSRHPIFQVTYSYSTTHGSRTRATTTLPGVGQRLVSFPGLEISLVEPEYQTAKFDLALFISETGAGLEGDFEYSSDLFERETIDRLVEHFKVLLEGIVADPSAPLSSLPLVGEAERQRLLFEWNDTAAPCPDVPLHALFEQQASRTPEAAALAFGDVRITYAELNARANRLAHHLRAWGVKPDALVGLCVERSPEMVVGLLAILKAGGAYLPLDPAYPAARLAAMLEDSGAAVLLTHSSLVDALPPHAAAVFCLDRGEALTAGLPATNPEHVTRPAHLAYCIYTSGSTGRPKGVALQHDNAVAFLSWAMSAFPRDVLECVLFSTSICFDLSLFELFAPLAVGGTVLLARDAVELADRAFVPPPTLINTVPSAAQALLDANAIPPTVRAINLAGEPLRPELVGRLRIAAPSARIHNLYGPTESTTYSTSWEAREGERIVVGQPIANTRVYILDERLEPAPTGVPGELYIAGAGLARGYWRRAELTAERFVPDPFGAPGSRMYRTGDRGRRLAGGAIELFGRVDHQVKVRGYRIELGEIENALLQCPEVAAAVVLAREDVPGMRRLVAYVVPAEGAEAPVEQRLRAHLHATLPEFMMPSAYVLLEALPLQPNGKIDRTALPAPDPAEGRDADRVAPRTATEALLATIWSDVLHLERIGVHDNFFDLGGHSLLATQVVARIRHSLQSDVSLREIFAAPTIAELAARLGTAGIAREEPIVRADRSRPPQTSFAQQRLWFLERFSPGSGLYNMPGAWRIEGPLDVDALQRSLDAVVRRHEILRTTFTAVGGVPVQIVADALHVPLPVKDLSDDDAAVQAVIESEGSRAFDLERGPLVRACVVRLAPERHLLLLTLHHMISDGWSMDVMLRELCAYYDDSVHGHETPLLPELPIQYADYAVWQRERLQGELLQKHLGFWSSYLRGAPATLDLPTDRPRPAVVSYRGAWIDFDVSPELSARVEALARRTHVTLFTVIAAAFSVLLHRYSGQDDLCIGYPAANRDRPEIEPLIGLFTNMLVLRSRVSPGETFDGLLRRMRDSLLDANAHRDLPFEKLVEELRPQRDPSRQPLFQAAVSLLEQEDLQLPRLDLTRIQPFDRTSKFDLTLFISGTRDGFAGGIEYATDLFDRETMARMVAHLESILDAVTLAPHRRIDDIPMLSAAERRQLLAEWNDTETERSSWASVARQIERQAAQQPDAVAAACGAEALSYRELNARANQLAHHLRELGVERETAVAVCVGRSPRLAVSLLAVLKAGGAYIPIDPDLPAARIEFMLRDGGARVVIADDDVAATLALHDVGVVRIAADWRVVRGQPADDLSIESGPLDLAYRIYTSGSTGRPKGVDVPHGGLSNLVAWHRKAYGLGPADRTTQVASVSFDACGWEVWSALTAGASLHIVDDDTRRSPAALVQWLTRQAITVCFLPTPLAEGVLAEAWPRETTLRALLTGGDVLHRGARAGDPFVLVNHYGPTECSVVATCAVVERGGREGRRPHVGRPIDGTSVYILDDRGEPVPIGVVGELFLGGAGLARGYAGHPALTAERFVPDPFRGVPGARMYRTGDLGRYLPDGAIELAGRADHQVKVRGVRIEPGEIEGALGALPGVRECVVVPRTAPSGDAQLVAYAVPDAAESFDAREWRRALQDMLPEPMIPSTFVALEALPLTASGKVDRAGLPAPEAWGVHTERDSAPRGETESVIAGIWRDLLKVDRVGVHDDFFALGGQSLLVIQAISWIRDALGVELAVSAFFDGPTVAEVAERVETMRWMAQEAPQRPEMSGDI